MGGLSFSVSRVFCEFLDHGLTMDVMKIDFEFWRAPMMDQSSIDIFSH